jgi:hypothetical protein
MALAALLAALAAGGESAKKPPDAKDDARPPREKVEPPTKPKKPAKPGELSAEKAEELRKLIKQLGAEGWADRVEAAEKIKKFGKVALPALKRAAKSKDQEVSERAKDLIEKIGEDAGFHLEDPPKEEPPGVLRLPGLTNAGTMTIKDGGRMNTGGISIQSNPGGSVTLVGDKVTYEGTGGTIKAGNVTAIGNEKEEVMIIDDRGKFVVKIRPGEKGAKIRVYPAKSRADFKKKYPKTYARHLATKAEKTMGTGKAEKAKGGGKADRAVQDLLREIMDGAPKRRRR